MGNGLYIPDNMVAAGAWFNADYYHNYLIVEVGNDGELTIGIKKTVRPVLMSKEEFFTKVIKAATKREQSDACISSAEHEQARQNVKTSDDANV